MKRDTDPTARNLARRPHLRKAKQQRRRKSEIARASRKANR